MESQFKFINKIRRFFKSPTPRQQELINKGCDFLVRIADDFADEEMRQEKKKVEEKNSICPLCRSRKIVNKIARVQGSGSVSGSFYLGGGSVYGSSTTDTNEVNHCNDCGNQWKKESIKHYSWKDALWLKIVWTLERYESREREGETTPVEVKDYVKTLSDKGVYAESLITAINKHLSNKHIDLSTKFVYKHFKSVYDE